MLKIGGRLVSELSDAELEAELERRRAKRGGGFSFQSGSPSPGDERAIRQAYANLELPFGASWSEIENQYRALLARFHPDKYRSDPEKYRTALEVVAGITRAYTTLFERLKKR
ncbi:MAG: DnaJ domain-containing protein [Deltaproteobacteria bacterium]|nr:DnaJ domain-containing protein [Sandaracinaceae bacterium]MCX7806972.1 DnaJ domain-containing protein [Deltaproteobacteria bacterium]MDW8247142.1 DnaJ domain-containing protein [Sandaracinaceae bacterium]